MDDQQYQEGPDFQRGWDEKPFSPPRSGMEIAAFVLAVISFFFISYFPFTVVPIGLSILFALLSKGSRMKVSKMAKVSILISAVSLIVGTVSFTSFVYRNWDLISETFERELERALEDPDSYLEDFWYSEESDPFSGSDPYDRFYDNSDDYGDLIDDLFGDSPRSMPSPMSPEPPSQQPSDMI